MSDLYAGIDLGGTGIKAVLGRSDGSVVVEDHIPTKSHEGPQAVLNRIVECVEAMSAKAGGRPVSLGMGVPGLVDVERSVTKFLPNMPTHWKDVPAGQILGDRLGCTVRLLNDVRTATLGELKFGHGRERPNLTMVFYALGTGIGGGIVIDGKLRLGPMGAAGELGHQTVLHNGPLCGCGNHGCLETMCSGVALSFEAARLMRIGQAPHLRELTGGDTEKVNTREMVRAIEMGDDALRDTIHRAGGFLGVAVANMITSLYPDMIVLGGGVAEIGPMLFDRVRRVVESRVRMLPLDNLKIVPSLVGAKAGELGALALAISEVGN
jgi:glucokinase